MGVQFWLPFVRSVTQGDSYPWALDWGVRGHGLHGDFWALVAGLSLTSAVLFLGWRGAPRLFHVLIVAVQGLQTAVVCRAAWTRPESFRFEGATIGVEFSLAVVGPILFGAFTAATVFWVVRDIRVRDAARIAPWIWTRATRLRLLLVLIAFAAEAALFRSGNLTSVQNVIGVLIVGWQWITLNTLLATMPLTKHAEAETAIS
jgi:hypothetical protein